MIYYSGSRVALHFFLIISTCILLLIGAGLFSSACGSYQMYVFTQGVGSDVSELGDGAGSFRVQGNVWHLVHAADSSLRYFAITEQDFIRVDLW